MSSCSATQEGAGIERVYSIRLRRACASHHVLPFALLPGLPSCPICSRICFPSRQVAANDEICQEVAAEGGVTLALQILKAGASLYTGGARCQGTGQGTRCCSGRWNQSSVSPVGAPATRAQSERFWQSPGRMHASHCCAALRCVTLV